MKKVCCPDAMGGRHDGVREESETGRKERSSERTGVEMDKKKR